MLFERTRSYCARVRNAPRMGANKTKDSRELRRFGRFSPLLPIVAIWGVARRVTLFPLHDHLRDASPGIGANSSRIRQSHSIVQLGQQIQ